MRSHKSLFFRNMLETLKMFRLFRNGGQQGFELLPSSVVVIDGEEFITVGWQLQNGTKLTIDFEKLDEWKKRHAIS